MRKIYLNLLFVAILSSTIAFGQNGWYQQAQLSTNNYSITSIEFSDSLNGFLTYNYVSDGYVYKTSNGGNTWQYDTSFAGNKLNALDIINGDVYVAGVLGKIYKRSSSTGIWALQTSGTSNELKDIQFVNSTTGYAVGVSGTLRKTVNSGSTWADPIISGGNTNDYNSVYFTSASNGVIVGTQNYFQGFSMQTVSGGQYWGAPSNLASKLNKVCFSSANIGYAVGNGGVIYKTINGGGAWLLKTSGVSTQLWDVAFLNDTLGYVVGENGTILKTINGGNTWASQLSNINTHLRTTHAFSKNIVWAAGDTSLVLKTNTGGLSLSITAFDTSVFCNGYTVLQTATTYNGSSTLQYSWASSAYLSSTSIANPIAGSLSQTTTFYVTVTDGNLLASDSATVSIATLTADSICLVSVMDSTNDNVIVFEKHIFGPIAYYKIYRETLVANVYDSIGVIFPGTPGIFIDTAANPMVQSYRYKISSMDSCGNETAMSNAHKTLHLTINQGLPGQWNLIWNNYEGVFINTYRIWRGDSLYNLVLIDSVAGNMTSYTDINPPSGAFYYQIEIVSSYMCLPYIFKAQTNYNTSRSNKANTGAPPSIAAAFSANPTTGTAPLLVNFSDGSQGSVDTWIWSFGDGDTSMVQNPSHLYMNAGPYDVKLYIKSGTLIDSITKVAYIDVVSSIEDIDLNKALKVYPNPASAGQSLFVEVGGAKIQKIEIFDIVGKQVYSLSGLKSPKVEVKLDKKEKGLFFMKVTTLGQQTVQRKLIIK
ncbi:MAG: hypothetical protein AUJ98_03115 [Bacteroidetes bacterium CG2_30_33_31]|nr:MAG: hypothetical protein AUJ98_03115 [Bacteroidetes bacterium CG2_30_33_31]